MTRAAKPINVKTLENKFRLSAISPPFLPFLPLFLSQFVHFIPLRRSTYLHLICGAAHDCYMQITDYPLQERLGDQETTGSGRSNYFPHFHNLSMMLAAGSGCLYYYVYAINYLNSPSA